MKLREKQNKKEDDYDIPSFFVETSKHNNTAFTAFSLKHSQKNN